MENSSLYLAFERQWQHTLLALENKANKDEVPTEASDIGAISYNAQNLTEAQKAQARANIGVSENGGTNTGTSFVWRGEYTSGTKYEVNDLVFYQGSTYICKIANAIAAPTQASFWEIFARGVLYRGEFVASSTTSYAVNDIVTYNGSAYICKTAVAMASETPDVSSSWGLLSEKGADGKSAYKYAQDAGYTGTEAEFSAKLAENIEVPTKLSDLTGDSTHRLVTDTEKSTWNAKANTSDIPTKVSELTNDKGYITSYTETDPTVPSWAKASTKPSYTKSEVGLGNVDNVKQYSASNPPPYPVTKVNGKTGAVTLNASDVGADASGTATSAISSHNTNTSAHADIRTALNNKADRTQALFYIEGDSSSTTDTTNKVATWIGSHSEIAEYFSGLTILYKVPTAGSTSTTLNINGLGAVTVVRNATTGISTSCPVDGVLLLTYTVDSSGTAYWKTADYDANTKNTAGTSNKTGTKMYLVGGTSQTSSGTTTYTNSNIYINTSNQLYSAKGFSGDLTGTATKATQDASGNVITSTYETKADATTKINNINTQISQLSSEKVNQEQVNVSIEEAIADLKAQGIQQTPEYANSIEECTDTTKMYVLPDGFIYAYMLTEKEVEGKPTYNNLLDDAINSDKTPYIVENSDGTTTVGYKKGWRINSSNTEKQSDGNCMTGYIPVLSEQTIRVKNITISGAVNGYFHWYKEDFSPAASAYYENNSDQNTKPNADGLIEFNAPINSALRYFRMTTGVISDETIITVDEEISESGGTEIVTEYGWASTGLAFVPANYEGRIIDLEDDVSKLKKFLNYGDDNDTESSPSYTNVLPSAEMGSDQETGWIEGKGYTVNARLSGSGGNVITDYTEVAGVCASGYIPVSVGDVVRIKNFYGPHGVSTYAISYNNDKTRLANKNWGASQLTSGYPWASYDWYTVEGNEPVSTGYANITKFEVTEENFGANVAFIRISGVFGPNNSEMIVTINEEIKEGGNSPSFDDDAINLIKNWDAPIYDANIPVFELTTEKAAMTNAAQTPADIYAKYDALMAQYPHYITKTDLGLCSDGVNHVYRYDFKEPDSRHTSGYDWSETKAKAIIVSGIHYEWAGIYGLYYALEEIAENPSLWNIRRNTHLIVVPCANPYATIASNYNSNASPNSIGVLNKNGVQIHRNFEVGFIYPGQSGYQELGTRNHGGTAPLSEVETQYIDNIMKENTDAAFFLTCHSFGDESFDFIWPSVATSYMCNMGYRLIDKMSNTWRNKYDFVGLDDYRTEEIPSWDSRLGHAHISKTDGTETRQATKYGIQGANVEINGRFWVHGTKANPEPSMSSFTMSRGAEVYVNFLLTAFGVYDHKDKKEYAPNLPWND